MSEVRNNINIYKGKVWFAARLPSYGEMPDVFASSIASYQELELWLQCFWIDLVYYNEPSLEVYATIFRRQKNGLLYRWLVIYNGMEYRIEEKVYQK